MNEVKILAKQNNSDKCIVCGKLSPYSLATDFYSLEGGLCLGVFTPKDEHQSYPDRLHGGMITAVLDETIGRAVQTEHPEIWGVTGKIEVTFKKPVPLNKQLKCIAKINKLYKVAFVGKGYIEDEDGNVLATATATYVRTTFEQMTESGGFVWEQFPCDLTLQTVEILHPELLD